LFTVWAIGFFLLDLRFHWFRFEDETISLNHLETEQWGGAILRELTPYANIGHRDYIQWFKRHRTRRRGLPVYKDYNHVRRNQVKDAYVKMRQQIIGMLVKLRMKGGLKA